MLFSQHQPVEDNLNAWACLIQGYANSALNGIRLNEILQRNMSKGSWWLETPVMLHTLKLAGKPESDELMEQARADASAKTGQGRKADGRKNPPYDVMLWWELAGRNGQEFRDRTAPLFIRLVAKERGSLLKQDQFTGIEVWTESELACLHALTHFAHDHPKLPDRIRSAVDWHVANTQPDNATNRPWAIHAFVERGTPESLHFAQTLLSNCIVVNAGQPDPYSAWILRNASLALQRL